MTRRLLIAAALVVTAAAARAQTPIADGQAISGTLSTSDPTLDDGSYFDLYAYRGTPGETVRFTLRSSDFDAYLAGGTLSGSYLDVEGSDDDSAGGTDAELTAQVGPAGVFTVRAANSLSAGETGAYTLQVQRTGGSALAAATPVREGSPLVGQLATGDARLSDDSFYDLFVYRGQPGEGIEVRLTSGAFDTYLGGGLSPDDAIRGTDHDDDGDGGTNSRLRVQTGPDGAYYIRANSLHARQTGPYTVTVTSAGADGGEDTGLPALTLGRAVSGRLDPSDPTLADGSHFDAYTYAGAPGEEIVVTLSSSDFDAYAILSRTFGGELEQVADDDDGGAGTDARIRATLSQSGTYVVVANSFGAGGQGAYSLVVQRPGDLDEADDAGFPLLQTGQPVAGALAAGDRELPDASLADVYLYRGAPGDRVAATLRSADFDAYLTVATVDAGDFTTVGQDDDGGGGRDARVEFTVGAGGAYAVQANSYGAGETGAYTLIVERIGGGTVAQAPTPRSRFAGKWAPTTYVESDGFAAIRGEVSRRRRLETIAERLNADYPLPSNVSVSFDECGQPNAFYSPRDGAVTFCYEMMPYLNQVLAGQVASERVSEAIDGAYEFIMLHEVGHALRHQLDLAITGMEEDVADQFATLVLIRQGDKGAQAAVDGVLALQSDREFNESDYADEHSLGPQRYYNVACWVYGSNPDKYAGLVGEGGLPEARARRCPGEYAQIEKSFGRLLGSVYDAR